MDQTLINKIQIRIAETTLNTFENKTSKAIRASQMREKAMHQLVEVHEKRRNDDHCSNRDVHITTK